MLISLHLPKTAGTSFLASLETSFGESLTQDYADRPLHHKPAARKTRALKDALHYRVNGLPNSTRCVHGHFLPLKYRYLRGREAPIFVTWLRDPVQRLISHYHYWRRSYDTETTLYLHRRMMEEDWELERFALAPELRNLYQVFLWGFPVQRFNFIGITERYTEDFQHFAEQYLDAGAEIVEVNTRPEGAGVDHKIDSALEKKIRAHHSEDEALYQWALKQRDQSSGSR